MKLLNEFFKLECIHIKFQMIMVFRFFISDWHHINNDFFNPNSEHSKASSKDSSQTEVPRGMFNVKLTFQILITKIRAQYACFEIDTLL